MRYGAKMMPMFLTVYLSNNDQHFTEVPITPETTCRDVVELCKEPGETECQLAEMWRGSERAIADDERMLDVLQHWGHKRTEVRFFLRHDRLPSRESGVTRPQDQTAKNGVKGPVDRRMENGVGVPRMDMTLSELQEMATRQQQQIDAQQQLLASKEQRLRYLKMHDQRQQQQASEQDKLQRLREIAENQEAKLKKVRALKGHVEQKRLSNGKLVEEIEQMNSLFQQKQRELVVAVSKVEELNRQLEMLNNGKIDSFHDNQGAVAELDRLYKELQLRNKLNQEQNAKLQQQRECLNKRNTEVVVMDKRVNELRDRLWKKKAALQHKENVPTVFPAKENSTKENQNKYFTKKIVPDSNASQQTGSPQSRVAAVGPYIQSSTVPRGPSRHDLLIKPVYPDVTSTLPVQDGSLKTQTLPMGRAAKTAAGSGSQAPRPPQASTDWSNVDPSVGHGSVSTLPRTGTYSTAEQDDTDIMLREKDKKVRPFSMFESTDPSTGVTSTGSLLKNQSNEDLLRDAQNAPRNPVKIPPPVPSKPNKISLSFINPSSQPLTTDSTLEGSQKPVLVAGTFPGKTKPVTQQPQPLAQHSSQQIQQRISVPPSLPATGQNHTLPLPSKQETPPAATVRPFTPQPPAKEAPPQPFHKPQTVAASSIYSMYTQQQTPGKNFQQAVQSTLTRAQTRGTPFTSVYGKPVIAGTSSSQQSQGQFSENGHLDQSDSELEQGVISSGFEPQETERIPRPLSPTKLLPFISNPYRHQSEMELDALRKKLYNAPRPLKKRSSITEPEGPNGPNIQKLLYQKTTLAAMETTGSAPFYQPNPAAEEENGPHEEAASMNDREGPEVEAVPETDTSEADVIKEQEDEFVPPPPPSHPAPIPEGLLESLSSPLPPGEEEHDPSAPLPLEAYMEEYPPYPPPPYPITGEQENLGEDTFSMRPPEITGQVSLPPGKRTNLRKTGSERIDHGMRVKFNPLALLLDSSLEGEFDLVQRIIYEVDDPSQPNDEGITALHNAVCAGHTEIVKFLVQFGVNVNAADSDGWTPLHCAASCNNVQVCKFLVESGAAVFAMTYSDMQTSAEKCEEMEEGYTQCSQFLYGVQEKMGIMNRGLVYGLWDCEAHNDDELVFREGDCMTTVRREDEEEVEWWWVRLGDQEGYVPRNLLGLYPRIKPRQRSLA